MINCTSKNMFLVVCSLFLSWNAIARCNGYYGDHLLKDAIKCSTGIEVGLVAMDGSEDTQEKISAVCGGGCYDAMFSPALKPDCDAKYAKVLKESQAQITQYYEKQKCTVDFSKIDSLASSAKPDCVWVSKMVIRPGTSGCGITNACFGFAYCSSGQYANETLQVTCDVTSNGDCPTLNECLTLPSPTWITLDDMSRSTGVDLPYNQNGISIKQ